MKKNQWNNSFEWKECKIQDISYFDDFWMQRTFKTDGKS